MKIKYNEKYLESELYKQSEFVAQQDNEIEERLRGMAVAALKDIIKNELTSNQREAIKLYFYEQKNMGEIATMLKVDVSTVSRTIDRAKATIYKFLKYYFVRPIKANN